MSHSIYAHLKPSWVPLPWQFCKMHRIKHPMLLNQNKQGKVPNQCCIFKLLCIKQTNCENYATLLRNFSINFEFWANISHRTSLSSWLYSSVLFHFKLWFLKWLYICYKTCSWHHAMTNGVKMIKMETASFSEMLATMYQTARFHNPEENVNLQYCRNFKSQTYDTLLYCII